MAGSVRWPALSLSLILHVGAIGLLTWIDIAFAPPVSPHYEIFPIPDEKSADHKIVWYDFRKTAPNIDPDRPVGPAKNPQGILDPQQTLITHSPDARSTRQVIRQPDQPKLLPEDVPAPNLVSMAVKLPPKVFVSPTVPNRSQTAAIAAIDASQPLDIPKPQTGSALGAMATLQKLPPKPFVAPPARSGGANAAPRIDVPDATSPDAQAGQVSSLQMVIVGLNPGATLPPPGSRGAEIARAPEAGTPSSGVNPASGTVVPGILSRGKPDQSTPASTPQSTPIPERGVPQEIVLSRVNRTMSAPLRPSSRVIPASVEARFANRNVYALVIPVPALPGYSGDWVMWFAEKDPAESSPGPRILAPIPARTYSSANSDAEPHGLPVSATFQFGARIDKTGHVSSLVVLRGPIDSELRRRGLEELGTWEFRPALRNGEAMDVDVVLEISFRFLPAGTSRH